MELLNEMLTSVYGTPQRNVN